MSRCSYCGHNGHNSRTCPDRGVKLFGVRLTSKNGVAMSRNFGVGNISHFPIKAPGGNVSDKLIPSTRKCSGRKKGVPWSEEEHTRFLEGLETMGKGDWRGISTNFVTTRTPAQVASHAQKYFLRQRNLNKARRRSSLLDMSADMQCSTGLSLGGSRESADKEEAALRRPIGVIRSGLFGVGIDGVSASPIASWRDLGLPSTICNRFHWSQWRITNSAKPAAKSLPFLAMMDGECLEHGTQLNLSIAPPSVDPPALSVGLDHQPSLHLAMEVQAAL